MKILSVCICLFLLNSAPNLSALRVSYVDAATSHVSAGNFYKTMEGIGESHDNHTVLAYKAASIVLMAKYESGIFSKNRLFNRGTNLLESIIKKSPDNYEARLLRLNIQDNVPWITGYTGDIKKDKAFLINNYARQPEDLKAYTKRYIMQCDAFTVKEKSSF
jgi:hypothetical protein